MKKYCPICGNSLDPKIHMTDFGKTPEELAEIQKDLLISLIKTFYVSMPKTKYFGESIIRMLGEGIHER